MKLNKLFRKLTTCWKRWVNRLEFFEFDGVFGPYKRKDGKMYVVERYRNKRGKTIKISVPYYEWLIDQKSKKETE